MSYYKQECKEDVIILKSMIEGLYKIKLDNRSHKNEYVTARAAFCSFCKTYYEGAITYAFLGELIGKNHATIIHYMKIHSKRHQKNDFNDMYNEWYRKVLAMHPRITRTRNIEKKSLLGYL